MLRVFSYITDLVILLVVFWRLNRALWQWFGRGAFRAEGRASDASRGDARSAARTEAARDPVCGMFVSTEVSERLEVDGQTLHFCSKECLERYRDRTAP